MNEIDNTAPLLHVCCAPCCGPIIQHLLDKGLLPTLFFYNPNIYPLEEYEYRKASVVAFALKNRLSFVDNDYDSEVWFERTKGLENEPERGKRCAVCFDMRLERTAQYAYLNHFRCFATTNGIARQKDLEQVNQRGLLAASHYHGLEFLAINWRKKSGLEKVGLIAKREHFYKQEYCGCVYSLIERNNFRSTHGLPPVRYGEQYY